MVDSCTQPLLILFMALGPKDVSKAVVGPLSTYSMQFMRLIHEVLGVKFKIDEYKNEFEENLKTGSAKFSISCLGLGFTNVNKAQL